MSKVQASEPCPTCGRTWNAGRPGKTPLAQALFAKRLKARQSMREAADEAGVDLGAYYRAEKGRMPSLDSGIRLAEWVGKSLDDLFMRSRP